MLMVKPGLNVLIDGQWGSTGKGKVAAYIATHYDVNLAVCDFQANAGHSSQIGDRKFVVHSVPTCSVNDKCRVCISPAATFNLTRMLDEIQVFDLTPKRLVIHPNAAVITQDDIDRETEGMISISSTCQGVGEALAKKIRRKSVTASSYDVLAEYIGDTALITQQALDRGETVLMETAQGFDLSLNWGWRYPFVTSRDVTTASAVSNCGVNLGWLREVIGVVRTFPIRVGNVVREGRVIGYSGGYHPDQVELTWGEMTEKSGSPIQLEERTTVTKKIRRVFTWSSHQFQRFLDVCAPTQIALTFADYIDHSAYGTSGKLAINHYGIVPGLSPTVNNWIYTHISWGRNLPVSFVGTGPDNMHAWTL